MSSQRRTIGFDRRIQLPWLDATADWVAQDLPLEEIRPRLEGLLEAKVAGEDAHSARGKTMTVLLHIWALLPDYLRPLRDDALGLLCGPSRTRTLPLHWGMCVATYPLFRDVATTTDRLLSLQGRAALSQVTQRTSEQWGDRSTSVRAVQRLVRTFVDWGVLDETEEAGIYGPGLRMTVEGKDMVGPWLVESGIVGREGRSRMFSVAVADSAYFPFNLKLHPRDLERNPRLELHTQGFDEQLVVHRSQTTR